MSKPHDGKSTRYEQHPIARQYAPGEMSEDELKALGEDMSMHGQKFPIILFEGKILDGMNRYVAATQRGITPKYETYSGDNPASVVMTCNIMRRKTTAHQRALAGAHLSKDLNLTQEEAARRTGVSKVHVSLIVQALDSKNARILKLLENPSLTREKLTEEMAESNIIINARLQNQPPPPTSVISENAALQGLSSIFASAQVQAAEYESGESNDLLGGDDDILGTPPSANGKVINMPAATRTSADQPLPDTGSRPTHPERRNKDTPAFRMAEAFKGLPESEKISFIQIAWSTLRPLLTVAGVSTAAPAASPAAVAEQAIAKAASSAAAPAAASPARGPARGRVRATKTKA